MTIVIAFVLTCGLASRAASAFTVGRPMGGVARTTTTTITTAAPATTPWSSIFVSLHAAAKQEDDMTLEEEIDMLVEEEKAKTNKMSKFSNAQGVQYAPWMKINEEDEVRIRQVMKERAEARRKRLQEEQTVRGTLMKDSTSQEISGSGLRGKVVDDGSVELEWATDRETNTLGYVVQRRAAKTAEFDVIASYKNYGPLASQGVDGGLYRFLDDTVPAPGGWVYRVTECEKNGSENDLSQCLVEIQTPEEKTAQIVALAGLGVIAIGALVAGLLLDPYQ